MLYFSEDEVILQQLPSTESFHGALQSRANAQLSAGNESPPRLGEISNFILLIRKYFVSNIPRHSGTVLRVSPPPLSLVQEPSGFRRISRINTFPPLPRAIPYARRIHRLISPVVYEASKKSPHRLPDYSLTLRLVGPPLPKSDRRRVGS